MRVSCVIGCYGDPRWRDLAWSRAYQSTGGQGFHDVVVTYLPDGTLAEARNQGVAEAEGDALIFLDADDELAPGYLRAMRAWLAPRTVLGFMPGSPEGDLPPHLVAPAVSYVYDGDVVTPPVIPNEGGWPRVNECVIGTLVARWLFERVGGFREWPSIEDYDLWLRCWDAGAQIARARDAVYRAHRDGSSAGRNLDQSCYDEIWAEHEQRAKTRVAFGGFS